MADNAWDGMDEALAKMRGLAPGLVKKGIRAAARRGAKVFADAAKSGARRINDPDTSEEIAKNIVIRESGREGKKLQAIVMRVGVLGGAKSYKNNKLNEKSGRAGKSYSTGGSKSNPGGDTFYWRFLEFGTSEMRAQPFMRPALDANLDKATAAVVRELIPQIDKQIKKAAK